MKIFNYSEDKRPIFLITSYFIFDLAVYFYVDNWPWFLAWYLFSIWPKGMISAWNHHHQHCFTFKPVILNRLLEIIYALQTGISSQCWVLHHNYGHHLNYLDQSKDESRWKDDQGQTMSLLKYTLVTAFTSYSRAYQVGKKYPKVQKIYLKMIFITLIVLGFLTWYRPLAAFWVFWLPMVTSLVLVAQTTFDHHSNLDTNNPYEGSRNVTQSKWYNILTGNLGYHTAHHLKHGLHWSKLPQLHDKIKHQIPAHCESPVFKPYQILDDIDDFLTNKFSEKTSISP